MAARQPRRGGVLWDIYGRKTSHFESFQSWTLRNVSHFESFEAWRPEKASHFESFRGWRPEKASHFESSGGWRLRKVCHGESCESFSGPGAVRPSAWGGAGAAGALLRCLDSGMVPRGPSVGGWIYGRAGPLELMVGRHHEAWQGASVTNLGSVSGGRVRFQPSAGWRWIPACGGATNLWRENHLKCNALCHQSGPTNRHLELNEGSL